MNNNEKRERDQKMKVDKRTKDYKRAHAKKLAGRPASGSPAVRSPAIDQRGNTDVESSLQCTHPLESVDSDGAQSSQLKRETDAIPDVHKTFCKRQIVSNWSKYETALPSGDAAYDVSTAADFGLLLQAPISEGGHFQFKSERIWEEHSPSQYSDMFSVDLKKLSTSLSCVPFYDQLGLCKDLFSEDELKQMDCEAEQNREQYVKLLQEIPGTDRSSDDVNVASNNAKHVKISHHLEQLKTSPVLGNLPVVESQVHASEPNVVLPSSWSEKPEIPCAILNESEPFKKPLLSETDDELDFLLSLKEPLSVANLPVEVERNTASKCSADALTDDLDAISLNPTASSEKKEDLEDWLDSMLDD